MTESIAIIDSGVNPLVYNIGPLQFDIEIGSDLNIINRSDQDPLDFDPPGFDRNSPGHGTTCAAIVKKYVTDASVGSIKVIDDEGGKGLKDQLIKALHWCAENGIKLVNLSLGTIDFRDFAELRSCVNEVAGQGLIVVAACNNRNVYTAPASLTNIIGVRCRSIYTDMQFRFTPYSFDGIDIEASGRHYLTDGSGRGKYTSSSNSYAAPFVTAMVYDIMKANSGISLENIKKELYKGALNFKDNGYYNPYICMNADWALESMEMDSTGINTGGIKNLMEVLGHKGIKVWEPGFYRMNLHKSLPGRQAKVNIPVIAVCTSSDLNIFDYLHSLLAKDGYYSIKVSTDCQDILQGSEYLPEGVDTGKFLSMVYEKYNCDIILVKTNGVECIEYIEDMVEFDVVLHVTGTENRCTCGEISQANQSESVLLEINEFCAKEHTGQIYGKILEFLTEL